MLLKFIAKSIWFTYVLIAIYIFAIIILNTLLYDKMNIKQVNRESINKWLSINFCVNLVAMSITLILAVCFDDNLPEWLLKIIHNAIATIVIQISNFFITLFNLLFWFFKIWFKYKLKE